MLKIFGGKSKTVPVSPRNKTCPGCGCDLAGQHWNHCPRCYRELPGQLGCGGCGACKH